MDDKATPSAQVGAPPPLILRKPDTRPLTLHATTSSGVELVIPTTEVH